MAHPAMQPQDVWALATQMGRMREVAAAWLGSGWLFEEHLRAVIAEQWVLERSKLLAVSEQLGFEVPEAYSAGDPLLLAQLSLDEE